MEAEAVRRREVMASMKTSEKGDSLYKMQSQEGNEQIPRPTSSLLFKTPPAPHPRSHPRHSDLRRRHHPPLDLLRPRNSTHSEELHPPLLNHPNLTTIPETAPPSNSPSPNSQP